MSQELRDSKARDEVGESFARELDRRDESNFRFGVIYVVVCLLCAGVAFVMAIKGAFMR